MRVLVSAAMPENVAPFYEGWRQTLGIRGRGEIDLWSGLARVLPATK